MRLRLYLGAVAAATLTAALATPAWAHHEHDARPLARDLEAGPYTISLWQVYPDAGAAIAPHLLVMVDSGSAALPTSVSVSVNSTSMGVRPSITTANGWETTEGLTEGDVVTVTIADGVSAWHLDPIVFRTGATSVSILPMQQLIYISIVPTVSTAWWVARRAARAWRRPLRNDEQLATPVGGS